MIPTQTQQPDNTETPKGDPFSHLHKMSTTAGLGSGEYVAVNAPAVVAILLGLGSALALLDPIFLIIALAGAVCAIISLIQIGRSNGTQTGRLLAVGGLLLSLGFTAAIGYREVSAYMASRRESAAIVSIINEFESHAKASEWDKAYALMGPTFKKTVTQEAFVSSFKSMEAMPYYGNVKSIAWNGQLSLDTDPATSAHYARAVVRIAFEKSPQSQSPHELVFQRIGSDWKIERISSFFGAEPMS